MPRHTACELSPSPLLTSPHCHRCLPHNPSNTRQPSIDPTPARLSYHPSYHHPSLPPLPLPITSPPGATFELLALATSRDGADPAFWTEEDPAESAALEPPVSAVPVKTLTLEGVLSMQVLLEEGPRGAAAAAAAATAAEPQPAGRLR